MTRDDLIAFEVEIAELFNSGAIRAPVHLAGGNEDELIEIFREVQPEDWVLSQTVKWFGFNCFLENVPAARPGLYLFICIPSKQPYVGISSTISSRCQDHSKARDKTKFGNALRKYGNDAFMLIPLFYLLDKNDRKVLSILEAEVISAYDAVKNGYNIQQASGAVGPYGPEFGKILSKTNKRPETIEHRSRAATLAHAKASVKIRHKIGCKVAQNRPNVRLATSQRVKLIRANPILEEKRIQSLKETLAQPEIILKRRETGIYLSITKPHILSSMRQGFEEALKDPITRIKIGDGTRGSRWINNGEKNQRLKPQDVLPPGWVYGVLR